VDRFTVWRNGSTAIWLDRDGARIVTDRSERGVRPWVPPPPQPRKAAAPGLPPAEIDRPGSAGHDEAAGSEPEPKDGA
jgi:competence protein ComEC